MKTKLLTAGLAILLIVTAFQTLRIERHKASYAELEAEYAGYKIDAREAFLKEKTTLLEAGNAAIQTKQTEIDGLMLALSDSVIRESDSERLLQQARADLHNARLKADTGSCEEARASARMCAELSTKLEQRASRLERRARIVSEYADRLSAEVEAVEAIKSRMK